MKDKNGTLDVIKQINDDLRKAKARSLDDARGVTPPEQVRKVVTKESIAKEGFKR